MKTGIIQIFMACLSSLGFSVIYNIRGKKLVAATLGGLVSWSVFLLLGFAIGDEVTRYFIVSVIMSAYSEIMARLLKTPTTTFIITTLIPLIPGGNLYYTMSSAFGGNLDSFMTNGAITLKLALSLALGVVVVTAFANFFSKRIKKKKCPEST